MNYDFTLPLYHNAASLFSVIKCIKTYDELENYAASIGYELNADYRGYNDPNDHPNYQQFFALHILIGEINALNPSKGDVVTVYFDSSSDDVLACLFDDPDEAMPSDFHNIVF